MQKINIFWFRRDLRLNDNHGLFKALQSGLPVLPIFIFDPQILEGLPKTDARVSFIHSTLEKLHARLQETGAGIACFYGTPESIFKKLLAENPIGTVFTNHDYEPYALQRDEAVKNLLKENDIDFQTFKDQVIFEKNEVVKDDGDPYVVYTPYMKKWRSLFNPTEQAAIFGSQDHLGHLTTKRSFPQLSLIDLGFEPSEIQVPEPSLDRGLMNDYPKTRDFPAVENGTSLVGPHLRFGTVSVREAVRKALAVKDGTFLNELIWREFFMQILWHFPHTVHSAFKPPYDRIPWRNDPTEFDRWKNGQTGYALVDAGMRQLNATGFMHNRVRMLVASFLCKHLLIDWRWGEAYFAEKLLDYEMASNVGNWQWSAGSGVDAAPYFRIFNPMTQITKFDPERKYIEQWVPDLQELTYPTPIVDHKFARERCLKTYKNALQ